MKIHCLLFCALFLPIEIYARQQILLVTGGSGYIGSAIVLDLLQKGHSVIVLDKKLPDSRFFAPSQKISSASRLASINLAKNSDLPKNVCFIQGDMADLHVLNEIFSTFAVQAVIHFAGYIEVGQSVKDPAPFYQNNVEKTLQLLNCMLEHKVYHFIFPSSASIYGSPGVSFFSEELDACPVNPYGKTKRIIEMILDDYVQAYPRFKAISLRFFNASGALPEFDIGERHQPETHLIPLVLNAAYKGTPFHIFGTDYATPDGTCIRDYLHIYDIAQAHYLALQYLLNNDVKHSIFNLGTGRGYTVKEVIECVGKMTGLRIYTQNAPRRLGDPDMLVADAEKARTVLEWQPVMSTLEDIVLSAHQFHSSQSQKK